MKSEGLCTLQALLRQQYKENASAALVTLKASGRAGKNVSCRIETGGAPAGVGLHPAFVAKS